MTKKSRRKMQNIRLFERLPPDERPTKEQLAYIVSPFTQNSSLVAYAASGKTNTVLLKILYHIRQGELLPSQFVLCSYTNVACNEMVERGNALAAKLGIENGVISIFDRSVNCVTIDKLAIKLMDAFLDKVKKMYKQLKQKLPLPYKGVSKLRSIAFLKPLLDVHFPVIDDKKSEGCEDDEDDSEDENEGKRHEVHKGGKEFEFLHASFKDVYTNLKLIIVDEAQDTKIDYFMFVKKIRAICHQYFQHDLFIHLVGDVNQQLYGYCSMKQLFDHSDEKNTYSLCQNFRNSRAICELANAMMPTVCTYLGPLGYTSAYDKKMEPMRMFQGQKPKLFAHRDITVSLQSAIEWIKSSPDILQGDIAFIVPKRDLGTQLSTMLSSTVFGYSHQMMFTKESDDVGMDDDDPEDELKPKKRKKGTSKGQIIHSTTQLQPEKFLQIFTIHGSKGLKFDTVILLGFYKSTWNIPVSKYTINTEWQFERFWFTAVTRAMNNLGIVVSTGFDLWQQTNKIKHLLDDHNSQLSNCTVGASEAKYFDKDRLIDSVHTVVKFGNQVSN